MSSDWFCSCTATMVTAHLRDCMARHFRCDSGFHMFCFVTHYMHLFPSGEDSKKRAEMLFTAHSLLTDFMIFPEMCFLITNDEQEVSCTYVWQNKVNLMGWPPLTNLTKGLFCTLIAITC